MKVINALQGLLVLLAINSCIVLNETGLNPGHIKSDEVAEMLLSAAIATEAAWTTATFGFPLISPSTWFTSIVAGIQHDKYYKEREVDTCVSDIHNVKLPEAALGLEHVAFRCKLEPDDILFDP